MAVIMFLRDRISASFAKDEVQCFPDGAFPYVIPDGEEGGAYIPGLYPVFSLLCEGREIENAEASQAGIAGIYLSFVNSLPCCVEYLEPLGLFIGEVQYGGLAPR